MQLNFRRSGDGPPLILLHGLFGSFENLGGIARPLAENFTIYALDLPNHGNSPHINSMSPAAMAAGVLQWMAAQKLQSVNLLGHSLGGKVAMEVALLQPETIKKLVVIDIAPVEYAAHHSDVFAGLLAITPEALSKRSDAEQILKQHVDDAAVRNFLLKNLVKDPAGGFRWRMNLSVMHSAYGEMLVANSVQSQFTGEVLFLKGGNSNYIQTQHNDAIVARFPHAQIKTISDTGHWLHAEKPEFVAQTIKKFLQS